MTRPSKKSLVVFAGIFAAAAVFGFVLNRVVAFNGPSQAPPLGTGAIGVNGSNDVSFGTATPLASTKVSIKGKGGTNGTFGLQVTDGLAIPTTILVVRDDKKVGIKTTSPTVELEVNGDIKGNFLGTLSSTSTISAANVTAGVFGSKCLSDSPPCSSPGAYSFFDKLGIGTSTAVGLPQTLSVYGNGYVSGNVGIGTTAPLVPLHVVEGTSGASLIGLRTGTAVTVRNDAGSFDNSVISVVSGINGDSAITFGSAANAFRGSIQYIGDTLSFGTAIVATSDQFRMSIDNLGRVGIATTSPAYRLDVATGDVNVQSGVYRKGGTQGTSATCAAGQVLDGPVVQGGIVTAGTCSAPSISGTVIAANVASGTFGANTGSGDYKFPGNLGINLGATAITPNVKLEVNGSVYVNANPEGSAGVGFVWDAVNNQRAGLIKQLNNNPEVRYMSSIPLIFRRVTAGTILSPTTSDFPLTLAAGGNVGIGTTSPGGKLDVADGGYDVIANPAATGGPVFDINTNNQAATAKFRAIVGVDAGLAPFHYAEFGRSGATTGPTFINGVENGGAGSVEIQRNGTVTAHFDKSGDVGIGTAAPQSRLQVVGNYLQLPTRTTAPPSTDCNSSAQAGRMVVVTGALPGIYFCNGTLGWVSTP